MTKRKAVSKSVRFEVFKRDNFTCQYCGKTAPEVVLHLEHINPVAGGGDNDIMNLLTSCEPCNLGKGARKLDDNSIITKQRAQLEELNARREQLEMMLAWRDSLANIDEEYIDAFNAVFVERTNCHLNEFGRGKVKKWLKTHALTDLLDALDAALDTYFKEGNPDDGEATNALAGKAFNMVPRIIASQKANADKPWMKDLFYIRAILRNRLSYCKDDEAIVHLKRAYGAGIHIEELKDWAKTARNWTNWRNEMIDWIDQYEAGGDL